MKKTLLIIALLAFVYPKAEAQLKGNATSIIVTPPLEWKYTLGGYGARMSRPAEGIHDNIMAKALVVADDSKKFVIVTMDMLGFPPNLKPMIIEKLDDPTWSMENVLLLPSHSHTSLEMFAINDKNVFGMPAIGVFQPELLEFVVDKLSNLIKETQQNLNPIQVGTGQITLDNLNRNRRGDNIVDDELTITRVDLKSGDPVAVLVNWTAHPTIMDDDDMLVSGGWPGYLQRELEDWIGHDIVAMYYNGAEGDLSVVANKGAAPYEKAEIYGRQIARQTLNLYKNIETASDADFSYVMNEITLPPTEPHPTFMQTGGEEYQLDEEKIQALLNQIFPAVTHTNALQLGELLIIGAPGEMIAELGNEIKSELKNSGAKYPVIGGLANEWISYILTEDEYHQGGYETSVSFYGPSLGGIIKEGMLNCAKSLNN